MAKDFFDGLGESFAKTMRELGGRAENFYSEQKLKNRIAGEEKQIQKIMEELGRILYRRYCDGASLEDIQKRLCEQIDQRMERIEHYKEQIAGVKAKKICPSCGAVVEIGMAFCPHCGAACTVKEQEEHAGDVVADGEAREVSKETAAEETASEEKESVGETVSGDAEKSQENDSEAPEAVKEETVSKEEE